MSTLFFIFFEIYSHFFRLGGIAPPFILSNYHKTIVSKSSKIHTIFGIHCIGENSSMPSLNFTLNIHQAIRQTKSFLQLGNGFFQIFNSLVSLGVLGIDGEFSHGISFMVVGVFHALIVMQSVCQSTKNIKIFLVTEIIRKNCLTNFR